MNFEGKTVLVTGGAGNLGQALAEAFSASGANMVLLDVKSRGNEKGLFIVTDLLDQKSVDAAAAKAIERFGRIDVLCNIAGGFRMAPLHETSDEDWNFSSTPTSARCCTRPGRSSRACSPRAAAGSSTSAPSPRSGASRRWPRTPRRRAR
jgi:dTDP-4-dehydrorhamnose reductase